MVMQGVIEIDLGEELRTHHAETDSIFFSIAKYIWIIGPFQVINKLIKSDSIVCRIVFIVCKRGPKFDLFCFCGV